MRNIVQESIKFLRVILGKDFYVKVDHQCLNERFGSEYGGWAVAMEGLNKDSIVYSFGIGKDSSFDTALIARFGLKVHGFDPTPQSIKWVQGQNISKNFIFHDYGIADIDGNVSFYPPENPDYLSHTILDRPSTKDRSITVPVKKLSTIMKDLGHSRIDVLKMDIEGAEYSVFEDIEKSRIFPEQILVEFHHRFLTRSGPGKTKDVISKLKKRGYSVFFVSDNNEELCFIRNKKVLV